MVCRAARVFQVALFSSATVLIEQKFPMADVANHTDCPETSGARFWQSTRAGFRVFAALLILVGLCFSAASKQALADDGAIPETVSYNKHVRSILSENCYFCHGPDPNQRKADLRLDQPEGAEHVINVDDPISSALVERIAEEDPDLQMPPPESGRTITDRQRKILTRWIEQGAQYEPHWAYIAPARPDVPKIQDAAWPRNDIDKFILSALEAKEIEPSVRAKPNVIVRRMHLDLIGLPPTPAEVASFCQSFESDANAAIDGLAEQSLDKATSTTTSATAGITMVASLAFGWPAAV